MTDAHFQAAHNYHRAVTFLGNTQDEADKAEDDLRKAQTEATAKRDKLARANREEGEAWTKLMLSRQKEFPTKYREAGGGRSL